MSDQLTLTCAYRRHDTLTASRDRAGVRIDLRCEDSDDGGSVVLSIESARSLRDRLSALIAAAESTTTDQEA